MSPCSPARPSRPVRRLTRRRTVPLVGVVLGALVAGLVAATPATAAAPGAFATSFETSDPAARSTTVEIGANGNPVRRNISGPTDPAATSLVTPATAVTASSSNGPGATAANLVDADPATRWQALVPAANVTYALEKPTVVTGYALTSAADAPNRDPGTWTMQGSTDGTTFTTLDTRAAQTFATRGQRATFTVAKPAAYTSYRLAITAPRAGSVLQLADLDLDAATTAAARPGPMVTATGNGPSEGLNIKQEAGFTGLHAYRYAGRQTAGGRVYETNVIQDGLAVVVGPKTELRYTIIPAYTGDDPTYPSTYAAIDLHFTDGTYLSQLSPVDQHGVGLTAAKQGDGKILYADQWNRESTDLAAVALGKTVDRVLLSYDDPTGVAGTLFGGWVDDVAIDPAPAGLDTSTLTNVVDTRRGTNASGSFSRGNNLPISAMPNGFTFLTPVTDASSNSWEYYYQQANNAQNLPTLQGFSVSHEPSPWMGDRNQLSVMPSASSTPTGSPTGRALAFRHDDETARPDYYEVGFQSGLTTELVPTDHGTVMRFTFPGDSGSLVFDTVDRNGKFVIDPAAGTVSGWVDNGSGLSAGRSRMFFAGTFSAKPTATAVAPGGNAEAHSATFGTKTVELRMATSFIGLGQAKRNAALELTGRSFDALHTAATSVWQQRLGVVTVEGASADQLRTLYGSLYRLNLYPNSQFENTGNATAPVYEYASPVLPSTGTASDTVTSAVVKAGKVYVNNGFWDTYRTVWPAYSLLYPEVAADLVDGFTQQYRDGGWVARWSSPGYADLMTGTSSDVAFAGAYLRGVPLKDPLATFDAAMKNATTMPTQSGVGRKGLPTSIFQKYTDTSTSESVSWQLEGDINDAGLAQMATALAADPRTPAARRQELRDDAAYLSDRAGQYVNLFDRAVDFFQGRDADGSFAQTPADYDPESWGGVYTETDGWNFAFHAPQDGQGLADLYGGRAALAGKLDQFFSTPELADKPGGYGGVIHEMLEARAVRMGQYGHSNQPSHHIPYMYDYVQQPYKTQAKVREIQRRLYVGSEIGQGYAGDEDNGEMSSWYILSSLGIYPLQSGSPNWVIGSPSFTSATVHRSTGDLTITASGNSASNVYVQSLSVNGKAHSSTSVTTQDLAGDARLDFAMGAKPSTWGTGAADVPASPTTGATAPEPDQDATTAGVGTLTASNGQDVAALTDDDQATQATFRGAVPTLTWTTNGASQKAGMYTLTSGTGKGDPTGWTLEASQNGRTWTTVDTRSAQTFAWRNQTRPFVVAHPGSYRMYRLVATSGGTASLSEVELLVKPGSSGATALKVTPTAKPLTARAGSPVSAPLATFLGAAGKPASAYSAALDWGDGATSAGTLSAGQLDSYTVNGTHTYAAPGWYRVAVTVTDGTQSATTEVGINVAVAATSGIVAGFDSTCIADDGTAIDCDGVGYSYSRQALAAAGAVQAATITVPGTDLHLVLPAVAAGQPDNAAGNGQTVPVTLPADATEIAFVGAGTQGDNETTATLRFSDGSSQQVPMDFPDWTLGGGGSPVPAGYTAVAASAYRLNQGAKDGAKPYLFAAPAITLPAGKTLTGVTMPDQPGTARDLRVHLFGIADDGTPAPALKVAPGAAATATTGVGTGLTLGRVTGGTPGATVTARVQWGDTSVTADATVTVRNGVAVVTGSHTWRAAGTYTVHVTASDGATSTTVAFRVTVSDPAQQAVAVSPSAASPGQRVTVTGVGFVPGEKVTVALSTPVTASIVATTDTQGRFGTTLVVPSRTVAGTYAVSATGSTATATTTLVVVDPAAAAAAVPTVRSTLVLSSTTATPGEVVSAQGAGYRPNQDVDLIGAAGNGQPVTLAVVRANADGVIGTTFTVPSLPGGLVGVRSTNALSPVAAPASSPFTTVATPRGTGG